MEKKTKKKTISEKDYKEMLSMISNSSNNSGLSLGVITGFLLFFLLFGGLSFNQPTNKKGD